MPHEVIMPALGMAQDTGLIVAWLKAPGEAVAVGDALMEVETDKATMEVEASHAGFLTDVRAGEGENVPVGGVVALISETAETAAGPAGPAKAAPAGPAAAQDTPQGREVIMPALGMAQDTGRILAWLKAPGDEVAAGEALLEVETDKATMEVEAEASGFLAALYAVAGEDVPVGRAIAVISADRPEAPVTRKAGQAAPEAAPKTAPEAASGAQAPSPKDPPGNDPAPKAGAVPVPPAPGGRILASPKARRLAAERGIDLGLLAAAGIPQPYHVSDLDRPEARSEARSEARPAAPAEAPLRLEAEIPAEAGEAALDWLAGAEEAAPDDLHAAFAAAAWREATGAGAVRLRHERPGAAARMLADPDLALGAPADGAPDLVLRDLSGGRITAARLGAGPAPVLTLIRAQGIWRLSLDFRPGALDETAAMALMGGLAARLEDPLRQLL